MVLQRLANSVKKLELATEKADSDECNKLISVIDEKIHKAKRDYNL